MAAPAPYKVCIVGPERAGKTCFLAGLSILGDPKRESPFTFVAGRDPGTQKYLLELRRILERREWPPVTDTTRLLDMDIAYRGRQIQIRVLDYVGEDIGAALKLLDLGTQAAFRDHLKTSDALLLFADPDVTSEDRLTTLLNSVVQMHRETLSGMERGPFPDVAVILTKADLHPGLSDLASAKRFARKRLPGLWSRLKDLAGRVRAFPISAVGGVEAGTGLPPREPAPRGYEALFDWILERKVRRTMARKLGPWIPWLGAAGLAAAVAAAGYHAHLDSLTSVVEDPSTPLERVAEISGGPFGRRPRIVRATDRRVLIELERLERRRQGATTLPELDRLAAESGLLASLPHTTRRAEAEGFRERVLGDLRALAFREAEEAYRDWKARQSGDFEPKVRSFLERFPAAPEAERARAWLEELRGADRQRFRASLAAMPARDAASIARKAERVAEYARRFGGPDAEEMERAARVALRIAATDRIRVRLLGAGGFSKPREFRVEIHVRGAKVLEFETGAEVRDAVFDREFDLAWHPGDPCRIRIYEYKGWDEYVAWTEEPGPFSLEVFSGRRRLENLEEGWRDEHFSEGRPYVVFTLEGFEPEDFGRLRRYVHPGDEWLK